MNGSACCCHLPPLNPSVFVCCWKRNSTIYHQNPFPRPKKNEAKESPCGDRLSARMDFCFPFLLLFSRTVSWSPASFRNVSWKTHKLTHCCKRTNVSSRSASEAAIQTPPKRCSCFPTVLNLFYTYFRSSFLLLVKRNFRLEGPKANDSIFRTIELKRNINSTTVRLMFDWKPVAPRGKRPRLERCRDQRLHKKEC